MIPYFIILCETLALFVCAAMIRNLFKIRGDNHAHCCLILASQAKAIRELRQTAADLQSKLTITEGERNHFEFELLRYQSVNFTRVDVPAPPEPIFIRRIPLVSTRPKAERRPPRAQKKTK